MLLFVSVGGKLSFLFSLLCFLFSLLFSVVAVVAVIGVVAFLVSTVDVDVDAVWCCPLLSSSLLLVVALAVVGFQLLV